MVHTYTHVFYLESYTINRISTISKALKFLEGVLGVGEDGGGG